jgi:hypothetical protein
MRHHRHLFLLAFTLASASIATAHAQPAPDAAGSTTGAATERARKLHVEAARLYDEGKYAQAYVAFVAAWAIKKHPSIAGNLADCEVKLGKYRDAAEHFRYIVADTSGDAKPADKRRAQERLDEVLKRIGVITLTAVPSGTELTLDGASLGKAPLPDSVFVDSGQHTLEGRAEGYLPSRVTFDVAAGTAKAMQLSLVPEPPPRRSVVPGAVIGGVAGVALATGIGLVAVAAQKRSTAQGLNQTITQAHQRCFMGAANYDSLCAELASTSLTSDTLDRAGVGVLIGAGAAAVGSLLYFVWPVSKPKTPVSGAVRVVPTASTTGGGIFARRSASWRRVGSWVS